MLIRADIIDNFIYVWFDYSPRLIEEIKKVPGFRFVAVNKPHGPAWRAPLEFETCKAMYQAMKDEEVRISPKLKEWGLERRKQTHSLVDLGAAKDVELELVPDLLPELHDGNLRPSQRVLAKFVAVPGSNPIIGDQPGTGKTRGTIAGVAEAGLLDGYHLVTAPRTALNTVWLRELTRWQPHPVFVAQGGRDDRETILEEMQLLYEMEEPFWLVVNPQMIALRRKGYDEHEEEILEPNYPEIHDIQWTTVIADEVHKSALQNPQALTAKAYYKLQASKRIAMSGTPLGGMPIKLWGILHWLHPDEFKSKWRFADQWMTVDEVQTKKGSFKKVGKIRKSREEEFQKFIAPYLLRRTKREIASELPPVGDPVEIWVEMTPKQKARYNQMALEAEVKIEDDKEEGIFSATSILAEYTRLKQFANAYCEIGPLDTTTGRRPVIPTPESGKLPALLEILEERGITKDEYDDPDGEKVIVFSQFTQFINMLATYLSKQGLPNWTITGETKDRDRQNAQDDFQRFDGGRRLILMNVNAGGTAITLDRADTVVFMDETWNPDDQTQGIDRAHRISRIHNVTPYFIRAKDSIEDYIMRVCKDKSAVNDMILDLWREGFRAIQ